MHSVADEESSCFAIFIAQEHAGNRRAVRSVVAGSMHQMHARGPLSDGNLTDARGLEFTVACPAQTGEIDLAEQEEGHAVEIRLAARDLRPAFGGSIVHKLALIK